MLSHADFILYRAVRACFPRWNLFGFAVRAWRAAVDNRRRPIEVARPVFDQ